MIYDYDLYKQSTLFVSALGSWSTLSSELEVHGLNLVPVNTNLIDAIWSDRPERPNNPLLTLDLKYTGTHVCN